MGLIDCAFYSTCVTGEGNVRVGALDWIFVSWTLDFLFIGFDLVCLGV